VADGRALPDQSEGQVVFAFGHSHRAPTNEENQVSSEFTGFQAESFEFFEELGRNNQKAWFDAHRSRYDQYVLGTFRGLLDKLTPELLELNPRFEVGGKTNGSFSRINRDIRFSKDKRPYKSNYYLYFYDSRHPRDHAGRLYVGLSADCVTVGFAIYGTWKGPKGALETIFRKRIEANPKEFSALLAKVVPARRYETYWHREEKGDWAQHPGLPRKAEDWQTLQAWIVRKVFLPNSRGIGSPTFAQTIQQVITELYPLLVFTSDASPKWAVNLKKSLR
jgi:uncharacterized protein (TIGR02453 family)